jgi:hypothetical protein
MAGVSRWETGKSGPASPATREERRLEEPAAGTGIGAGIALRALRFAPLLWLLRRLGPGILPGAYVEKERGIRS